MTRSITHLGAAGNTNPAARFTSRSRNPSVRRCRCAYTNARASCHAPLVIVGFFGFDGSAMLGEAYLGKMRRTRRPVVETRTSYVAGSVALMNVAEPYSASTRGDSSQ